MSAPLEESAPRNAHCERSWPPPYLKRLRTNEADRMTLAVIYRWRIKPGMEEAFARGWSARTRSIHEQCGSYGARLHRGEGDLWMAYARWPDEAMRQACAPTGEAADQAAAEMRAAVAETFPEIVMTIVGDQLDEPARADGAPSLPPTPLDAGDGVLLRPLDPAADAEALHACFTDAATAEFLLTPPHATVAETRRRLLAWSGPTSPQWAIVRGAGPVLARITLISRRAGVGEVGFQVVPAARRQGLARRAVCAVTRHALDELGLVRVFGNCDPRNVASVGVFERAGFVFEGRLTNDYVTPSGVADSLIYAATTGWTLPK
jgi:RimJ/RimL family protein N-acetyltransferase/heme-degrading monooxygenase HmoA